MPLTNKISKIDTFKQTYGYSTFEYWNWFAGEDAADVMESLAAPDKAPAKLHA